MILVVDASVAVKWFVPFSPEEANADMAVAILQRVGAGAAYLVQPPHFIAEVAAVLARIKPAKAASDLVELMHIPQRLIESAEVYGTALELATDFHTICLTRCTMPSRFTRRGALWSQRTRSTLPRQSPGGRFACWRILSLLDCKPD